GPARSGAVARRGGLPRAVPPAVGGSARADRRIPPRDPATRRHPRRTANDLTSNHIRRLGEDRTRRSGSDPSPTTRRTSMSTTDSPELTAPLSIPRLRAALTG